jgi:hypothetical protein
LNEFNHPFIKFKSPKLENSILKINIVGINAVSLIFRKSSIIGFEGFNNIHKLTGVRSHGRRSQESGVRIE